MPAWMIAVPRTARSRIAGTTIADLTTGTASAPAQMRGSATAATLTAAFAAWLIHTEELAARVAAYQTEFFRRPSGMIRTTRRARFLRGLSPLRHRRRECPRCPRRRFWIEQQPFARSRGLRRGRAGRGECQRIGQAVQPAQWPASRHRARLRAPAASPRRAWYGQLAASGSRQANLAARPIAQGSRLTGMTPATAFPFQRSCATGCSRSGKIALTQDETDEGIRFIRKQGKNT